MIQGVILLAVIGAAAGLLATRLMRVNMDLPSAMGLGVLGALAGGLVLRLVVTAGGWMITFVLAVMGSMALIWIWQHLKK